MTRRILVTGANGFLGAALVSKLVEREDVAVCGVFRRGESRLIDAPPDRLTYIRCDLAKTEAVGELLTDWRPEVIVHTAAALTRNNGPDEMATVVRDNVLAQANLLTAAMAADVGQFVYCSSISVYGSMPNGADAHFESHPPIPKDIYGWSKLAGERILEVTEPPGQAISRVSLRLAGVHGSGRTSGVVHALLRAAIAGEPLRLDEPESRFRFLFVDDAVAALLLVLERPQEQPYACFNVAGAETISLRELAEKILHVTGSASPIEARSGTVRRNKGMDISAFDSAFAYKPLDTITHLKRMITCLGS